MVRDKINLSVSLAAELQISGNLIWSSIENLNNISFNNQYGVYLFENSFMCLYQASQGVERLEKIIVELICEKENIDYSDKTSLEYKLLHSHNHTELQKYIKSKTNCVFGKEENKLLQMLQTFYNDHRYIRYIDGNYKDSIQGDFYMLLNVGKENVEDIDSYIKSSVGKSLGLISNKYYNLIRELSTRLNIFVNEIQGTSKANLVFYNKDLNKKYNQLKNAKKELLYWLLTNFDEYPKSQFAEVDPLDFDPQMIGEYLDELLSNRENSVLDEVESIYEDETDAKKLAKRKELLDFIISGEYYSNIEDEEEEQEQTNKRK